MSRFTVLHQDKGLAFGNDHATGEFLQIWLRPSDPEKRRLQDQFGVDPNEMLVDKDTMFHQDFNREVMLKLIKEHGFTSDELSNVYKRNNVYSVNFEEDF